jgi:hypothetical protein
MRPLGYCINITLDGCCDHRAMFADEELHRHAAENLAQADALLFGRATYEIALRLVGEGQIARPSCSASRREIRELRETIVKPRDNTR